MDHKLHSRLIAELDEKVQKGPPAEAFQAPHFQGCWSLAKKIGPNFKTCAYPRPADRELSWKRYDKAITKLKNQQAEWEKAARVRVGEISALLDAADPKFGPMQALLNAQEETAVITEQKEALRACSVKYKEALALFMASKQLLSHLQFKDLSTRFKELKRKHKAAWDSLPSRKGASSITPAMKTKRENLLEKIRNEHASLEHQQNALRKFERERARCTAPQESAKLDAWIKECHTAIEIVERELLDLETKLAQLST